jgi:hypothetical protein
MVKNSDYMTTRKSVRDKKAAENLEVYNAVAEASKSPNKDSKETRTTIQVKDTEQRQDG